MPKQKIPRSLSRAEWQVMNICWRRGRSTAREIYDDSQRAGARDYQTVKTLLDRIVAKGYLTMEKVGPVCVYVPKKRRTGALREAIHDFVDTVLDHTPQPLVAHLAERDDLDDEDLALLRAILSTHEEASPSRLDRDDDDA